MMMMIIIITSFIRSVLCVRRSVSRLVSLLVLKRNAQRVTRA